MHRSVALAWFTAISCAGWVAGCGGDKSPPLPTSYDVAFASTNVAVAAEGVEVLVFDATAAPNEICNALILKRRTNQDLGPPLARSIAVHPCELLAGNGGQLDVSFGKRAFFGVARRGQADFLLGCTVTDVGAGGPAPLINLDYASDQVEEAPPTKCARLGDRCRGAC